MSIRIRLKQLREERGLSQAAMAKELGVCQSTVAAWESGVSAPTYKRLQFLADHFNCSVDYLTGADVPQAGRGVRYADMFAGMAPEAPVVPDPAAELYAAYLAAPEEARRIIDAALEPYRNKSD